jgi:ATP-dependent Clp protease adaptor protein ClpS
MTASTTVIDPGTRTDTRSEEKTRLAPVWKVILLNDDTTTFEFVIDLLRSLFQKPHDEAVRLTREIHETGSALIIRTNREHAELYVEQVRSLARPRGYPLTAMIEPD